MNVSGIILAGGKSRRMGRNKALLDLGGLTLIERVAGVMSGVCREIIIAGGDPGALGSLGYPVVPDAYPGCGPLSGIHAGIMAAGSQYCFISACDIPFLSEKLIRRVVSEAEGYDAVILMHGEFYEPLCSLYGRAFAAAAETSIKKGAYKVMQSLELVKWKPLAVEAGEFPDLERSIFNINTPGDYEKAKKLGGGHRE